MYGVAKRCVSSVGDDAMLFSVVAPLSVMCTAWLACVASGPAK